MHNYIAFYKVIANHTIVEQQIAFCATDDEAAVAIGHDYRRVLSNAYCHGEKLHVRVRIMTLEIGTYNFYDEAFDTTYTRQLLDTNECQMNLTSDHTRSNHGVIPPIHGGWPQSGQY